VFPFVGESEDPEVYTVRQRPMRAINTCPDYENILQVAMPSGVNLRF